MSKLVILRRHEFPGLQEIYMDGCGKGAALLLFFLSNTESALS